MKKSLLLLGLFVLIFSGSILAQPPDPGGPGNELPGCFPPPCVPIDGGLSWLLIAGTAYGGKKMYDLQQKEESNIED